ncbi:MAG: hypothetical protein CMD52_08790 [Gammaproteobacteria bacterium]|jgi:hypothetical protein|nr:hypothetical protein [Gammaproteobacteria bacterium]|tara:strand:+ start:123 stop:383 length:261 start_codon:yes stop_codon:yes gene_type:complete
MTDELALQRMIRLSEEAEKYEARLLEMAAKMKLFRKANGRDAETEDILNVWVEMNLQGPLDPYLILTRDEVVQVWEDAEDPQRQSK